jgi:hypothetical protein
MQAPNLSRLLDAITGFGTLIVLVVAEAAQALAAPILMIVFILLEADRITLGVKALGQHTDQANLIALAFCSANALLPLYRLRAATKAGKVVRHRVGLRGYLGGVWGWMARGSQAYEVDSSDNPTLHLVERAVTGATIFLAFFAVLEPMLAVYKGVPSIVALGRILAESDLIQMIELAAGFLLAVGGVFGVQALSWEFGVRSLNRPSAAETIKLPTDAGDYSSSYILDQPADQSPSPVVPAPSDHLVRVRPLAVVRNQLPLFEQPNQLAKEQENVS